MIYVHDDSIMSYLIALYVWYHGNNLSVFGIEKGMVLDKTELNTGMKTPDEIDPLLVDSRLIEEVKVQNAKERNTDNWEKIMREAINNSQIDSYKMSQAGLVDNTIFDNSSETTVDMYNDNRFDKSLFDELNGITKNNNRFDPNQDFANIDPWRVY